MGDLILTDFKTKTWHRAPTLEQQAAELAKEFNRMADEGTEVVCVLYGGAGIDGMYVAPSDDCA